MTHRAHRAVVGARPTGQAPAPKPRKGFVTPEIDTDSNGWRTDGACLDEDPELFFSDNPQDIRAAVAVCHSCPVMFECRTWATDTRQRFGVWGGVDLEERSLERPKEDALPDQVEPAAETTEPASTEPRVMTYGERFRMIKNEPEKFVALVLQIHAEIGGYDETAARVGLKSGYAMCQALARCGKEGKAAVKKIRKGRTFRRAYVQEPRAVRILSELMEAGPVTWDEALQRLGYTREESLYRVLQRAGRQDMIKAMRPDYRTREEVTDQSMRAYTKRGRGVDDRTGRVRPRRRVRPMSGRVELVSA